MHNIPLKAVLITDNKGDDNAYSDGVRSAALESQISGWRYILFG